MYLRNDRIYIRDQYARPIQAIIKLDIIWEQKEWQKQISNLSKDLHNIASILFKNNTSKNSTSYLKELETVPKFWKMVNLIRKNIIDDNLRDAISYVTREGKGQGIKDAGEWRVFECMDGIEKKTAQDILNHFGDLEKTLKLDSNELTEVKAINIDKAKKIYENIIQKWRLK
ncbi:hypothetical protein LCGC14_1789610 [marine sediment metagenome]|uniref:Uncharacterized protein n=1 Tax=marine sediment metagenome TaxID=412755 RepID=A0A0F9HFI2_9ZZZZ